MDRPGIYRVERYALRSQADEARRFFRDKVLPYYQRMPGVKSVRAYRGRFGFGPLRHDIEVWMHLKDMASLDALEDYVVGHQEEVVALEKEWEQHFENRGSRLMGDWPDPRWESE